MLTEILRFLSLPESDSQYELKSIHIDSENEIEEGYLLNVNTNDWYRIENCILDLRPIGLQNREKTIAFAKRHNLYIQELKNDKKKYYDDQTTQIDFFKNDSKVYDETVTNLPFYRMFDSLYQQKFIESIPLNSCIIDIGGGTGRQSIPIALRGHQVILTDISEEMLTIAVKKAIEKKVKSLITFVLCDASELPFRSSLFDVAVCFGSLHHMPDAGLVIMEASRVVKDSGQWFSIDPHNSPARIIFDLAMKLKKLYDEVAADDIHLDKKTLSNMLIKAKFKPKIVYSTYLLPHIMNFLPFRFGRFIIYLTDLFFGNIPFLNRFGGIIIAHGKKLSN
jgi:ubiquinone/menaquinone biosynthesis C-methylase UbiE